MVIVNGVQVSQQTQDSFSRATGACLPAGRWWYDRFSGAWGTEGGPTLGFTRPALDCFALLREDASRGQGRLAWLGRSRIYVNGRELHPSEAQWLMQLLGVGAAWPGTRYWMDHLGNLGLEGGPRAVNLFEAVAHGHAAATLSAVPNGGGHGYLRRTNAGYVGGDGNTSYFFDPATGSSVMV